MQLRSGKCTQRSSIVEAVTEEEIVTEKEVVTINKFRETHIYNIKNLLDKFDIKLKEKEKALVICDVYNYVYELFRDLYELKHVDKYNRILKTILKKFLILLNNVFSL